MPWHIVENSRQCPTTQPFAVVKDADGSVEGCHETRQGAEDQMAALYASEEQARGGLMEFIQKFVDGIVERVRQELGAIQRAWDGSASNYASTDQYCSACLIDVNSAAGRDERAQSHCMLPTKRPGSDTHDFEGVQAAAGGRGITRVQKPDDVPQDAWDTAMRSAANTIITQYGENDRTAPDSVYEIAGKKPPKERGQSVSRLYELLYAELEKTGQLYEAWIHDIYLDDNKENFAVISKRGKLYQVPITMDGDDVSFGEWREVVEEFRPAMTARTIVRQQPDGWYRWLSISATSVLNRVGEIDSAALFDSFIKHVRETGEYPIRDFYHLGRNARIGKSDFLARDGVAYINSGLFDKTPIALAIARDHIENPEYWGDSITYLPTSSPEMMELQGVEIPVYKTGVHRATATLPEARAASWFTNTEVTEVMRMRKEIQEELDRLKESGGLSDEDVAAFVSAVDGINREADGLIHREAEDAETEDENVEEEAVETATEDTPEQEREQDAESEFVLDESAVEAIGAQFSAMLEPLSAEIATLKEQIGTMTERMAKAEKDIQTSVGAIDRRIQTLEGAEKTRQDDTPRNQKMRVTYRPRMANAQESEGDNGAAGTMADVAEGTLSNLPAYG
jgi:hypothetical protein